MIRQSQEIGCVRKPAWFSQIWSYILNTYIWLKTFHKNQNVIPLQE